MENNNTNEVNKINTINIRELWQPITAAVILLVCLFQKWIRLNLDLYFTEIDKAFSLGDIKEMFNSFYNLADEFGYSAAGLDNASLFVNGIYILLWAVIIAEIAFIVTKIINADYYKLIGKIGSCLYILLIIIIAATMAYFMSNFAELSDTTYSLTNLPITVFPIIGIFAAIWQLITASEVNFAELKNINFYDIIVNSGLVTSIIIAAIVIDSFITMFCIDSNFPLWTINQYLISLVVICVIFLLSLILRHLAKKEANT